ncbi:aspartate aminotransferase family protein [Bacterioplanoides sp.]|uniref:aminotransferase family protein n=1 Tax=Bacterioplanoides sp. TaxID=2066072 RepID=UPI003B5B9171
MTANYWSECARQEAEYLLHPASSISQLIADGPGLIAAAQGCEVTDEQGNQLLDGVAGLWCVNVGYGRYELAQVMKEASLQLSYYHSFSNATNPWQGALAKKLVDLTPEPLSKVFFGSGGSDANDSLIKIAWHYFALKQQPSKKKVIARQQAYHGTSVSTSSLTGLPSFHNYYPLPLDFVLRVECPHFYTRGLKGETEAQFCQRLIDEIKTTIEQEGAENIAAFIAEPIMGAGGVIPPPKDYFKKLQPLLKQNDILLIVDEVVCAFGRTGHWFASEYFDIEADMLSCAKGLSSGYFPMSASLISDEIWQVLVQGSDKLGAFSHGYTYSGHPVGAAVALANIQILENEQLIKKADDNGRWFQQVIREQLMLSDHVGEVRGLGLLAGVQLVVDKQRAELPDPAIKWPAKVVAEMRKSGVIARPLPGVGSLALSPPLIISREQLQRIVDVMAHAIKVVTG